MKPLGFIKRHPGHMMTCPICPESKHEMLYMNGTPVRHWRDEKAMADWRKEEAKVREVVGKLVTHNARIDVLECLQGHRFAIVEFGYRLLDREVLTPTPPPTPKEIEKKKSSEKQKKYSRDYYARNRKRIAKYQRDYLKRKRQEAKRGSR